MYIRSSSRTPPFMRVPSAGASGEAKYKSIDTRQPYFHMSSIPRIPGGAGNLECLNRLKSIEDAHARPITLRFVLVYAAFLRARPVAQRLLDCLGRFGFIGRGAANNLGALGSELRVGEGPRRLRRVVVPLHRRLGFRALLPYAAQVPDFPHALNFFQVALRSPAQGFGNGLHLLGHPAQ